jgi:anthranilate phosphoribosyltransferase
VCKHGGRAASSLAGSADVLEALGVAIELDAAGVARCVEEVGIGFCFAPRFHASLRFAGPTRRELGVPTAFNFLGPLANPGRVRRQVVGVGDPAMAAKMAGVLAANGAQHVAVVYGHDGLDELSTVAPSTMMTWVKGASGLVETVVDPAELGLAPATLADLRGGDPSTNARYAQQILSGAPGPQRDIVVLNAAAGLVVGGAVPTLAEGVKLAAVSLDSGAAERTLAALVAVSQAAARGGS